MISLEDVYLSSCDESLMSKWQCTLHLKGAEMICEDMIIVPSITPGVKVRLNTVHIPFEIIAFPLVKNEFS